MITQDEYAVASAIEVTCNRALSVSKEIERLEEDLKQKRIERGYCLAELCYAISLLEKAGSPHAVPFKLIVGMTDIEIGIEAGKYIADLECKRAKEKLKRKEKHIQWTEDHL